MFFDLLFYCVSERQSKIGSSIKLVFSRNKIIGGDQTIKNLSITKGNKKMVAFNLGFDSKLDFFVEKKNKTVEALFFFGSLDCPQSGLREFF